MEDKEQRIKIQFDTNADETSKKVDGLSSKLEDNKKGTKKGNSAWTVGRIGLRHRHHTQREYF